MSWTTVDVAPGITRIESILGPRPFAQYLFRDERALLVDTGVKETPADVLLPALDGLEPDFVVISHADVDHFGGNSAIRAAAPRAVFCAHAADTDWIESRELILRERYGWYDEYGLAYDDETSAWLRDSIGPDVPVDLQLQGGEFFRLGPSLTVEVLHLPGHSLGHVGVWDPGSRTAVIQDAVLGIGLLDLEGNVIHPPPYVDLACAESSARLLRTLRPERLLTAHYPVFEGDEVRRFLDASIEFVDRARRVVEASEDLPLHELLSRADAELGPFTSMPNELGATLRAALQEAGREVRA